MRVTCPLMHLGLLLHHDAAVPCPAIDMVALMLKGDLCPTCTGQEKWQPLLQM